MAELKTEKLFNYSILDRHGRLLIGLVLSASLLIIVSLITIYAVQELILLLLIVPVPYCWAVNSSFNKDGQIRKQFGIMSEYGYIMEAFKYLGHDVKNLRLSGGDNLILDKNRLVSYAYPEQIHNVLNLARQKNIRNVVIIKRFSFFQKSEFFPLSNEIDLEMADFNDVILAVRKNNKKYRVQMERF